MYAHVENGSVTYRGSLPKTWRSVSGLNLSDGEDTVITETEVTATAKKRAMTADEKTARDNSEAKNEILRLEILETPQRLAEALPDDSGGSADGRAWFKDNRAKIAIERARN